MQAQTDQGAVTGTVPDSTGAIIARADVTLTSIDNGLVLARKTDASGVFVFSPVKIGNYNLTATAAGFKTTSEKEFHLNLQDRLQVDVKLEAGAVSETVEVTSAAPLCKPPRALPAR